MATAMAKATAMALASFGILWLRRRLRPISEFGKHQAHFHSKGPIKHTLQTLRAWRSTPPPRRTSPPRGAREGAEDDAMLPPGTLEPRTKHTFESQNAMQGDGPSAQQVQGTGAGKRWAAEQRHDDCQGRDGQHALAQQAQQARTLGLKPHLQPRLGQRLEPAWDLPGPKGPAKSRQGPAA